MLADSERAWLATSSDAYALATVTRSPDDGTVTLRAEDGTTATVAAAQAAGRTACVRAIREHEQRERERERAEAALQTALETDELAAVRDAIATHAAVLEGGDEAAVALLERARAPLGPRARAPSPSAPWRARVASSCGSRAPCRGAR